jgi:hypothetical protein
MIFGMTGLHYLYAGVYYGIRGVVDLHCCSSSPRSAQQKPYKIECIVLYLSSDRELCGSFVKRLFFLGQIGNKRVTRCHSLQFANWSALYLGPETPVQWLVTLRLMMPIAPSHPLTQQVLPFPNLCPRPIPRRPCPLHRAGELRRYPPWLRRCGRARDAKQHGKQRWIQCGRMGADRALRRSNRIGAGLLIPGSVSFESGAVVVGGLRDDDAYAGRVTVYTPI